MAASIPSLLADELGISESRARDLLGAMVDEIRVRVRHGHGVRIQDFGTFRLENGQVCFVPDRALARSVNHRFEGLEPETLYLEEPSSTPVQPYPRPPSDEFDFETEMAPGSFEIETPEPVDVDVSDSSPEPSLEATPSRSPDEDPSAPSTPTEPKRPEPDPVSASTTGDDQDPTPPSSSPEVSEDNPPGPDDTEDPDAEPDETPTDTDPNGTHEPEAATPDDPDFFPSLHRIIGVEEPNDDEASEPQDDPHPLSGIMKALSDSPSATNGDAASDDDASESAPGPAPGRAAPDHDDPSERSATFDPFSRSSEASDPQRAPRRPSAPQAGDFPPPSESSRSSRAASWTDNVGPIVSGIVVIVLLAAGVWFVLGQYSGNTGDPLSLPNSSTRLGTGSASPSGGSAPSGTSPRSSADGSSSGNAAGTTPGMNGSASPGMTMDSPSSGRQMSSGSDGAMQSGSDSALPDDPTATGIDRSRGGWTIVVRSRQSQQSAARWLNENREQFSELGFQVDVLPGRSEGQMWYRVSVGQFSSAAQARTMMNRYPDAFPRDAWPLRLSSSPTR
jgi:hypothetical protein